jgi:DUF4097 and DUF4098 domain-containing protein YvlB
VGDSVTVRQQSRWSLRARSLCLLVIVPDGAELEMVSASADLRTRGDLGAARVRTTSGDIELDGVGRLEVATTSGDVRVARVHGDATVTTVSGDATLAAVTGRLGGSSVSGDVRADVVGGDVRFGTTSGDVAIGRCDGGAIALKSISGDLSIGLPSGLAVEADLSTTSGRASLPDPAPDDGGAVARRPVRLAMRTVSGDLTVKRA